MPEAGKGDRDDVRIPMPEKVTQNHLAWLKTQRRYDLAESVLPIIASIGVVSSTAVPGLVVYSIVDRIAQATPSPNANWPAIVAAVCAGLGIGGLTSPWWTGLKRKMKEQAAELVRLREKVAQREEPERSAVLAQARPTDLATPGSATKQEGQKP